MPKRTAREVGLLRRFGRRLRSARITAGYDSAEDFADDIGIEAPAYRKYERGESQPRIDTLEDIVRLLGCDCGWLLFGLPTRKPRQSPDND
jgi:transcriptional regulator with XRE-family HTH domain